MKYDVAKNVYNKLQVLPLTREWIEISAVIVLQDIAPVLPLTREWIEISILICFTIFLTVLPLTREWIEIDDFD